MINPKLNEVLLSKAKYKVLVTGRQVGKTFIGVKELVKSANKNGTVNLAIGPSLGMAYSILFPKIKAELELQNIEYKYMKSRMTFILNNNSTIIISGADRINHGHVIDFALIDEFDYMDYKIWTDIILPSLKLKKGKAFINGTPKGFGNLAKLYLKGQDPKHSKYESWRFKTSANPALAKEHLEETKRALEAKIFLQEYEAEFISNIKE